MSDDTRRILDLLAQGRITVDEAAELIKSLGAAAGPRADAGAERARSSGSETRAKYLRIAVHKAANQWRGEKNVNIRVPLALVRGGMRLGALVPGLGDDLIARLRERGIDLSKLDQDQLDSLLNDLGEITIDADQGQQQVRITCE
jgi:hypothetical protein